MLEAMSHAELLRRASEDRGSLSEDELSRFVLFRMANMRIIETAFVLQSEGTLDEETFDIFRRRAALLLKENPDLLNTGLYTHSFRSWLSQLSLDDVEVTMPYMAQDKGGVNQP